MSRRESFKEDNCIDVEFSSGDCNRMSTKRYQEENNNEVDELSKDLQMGCIIDAVKKPPNICVENVVHREESDSEDQSPTVIDNNDDNDEDRYSDEFEEDKSEDDALKDDVKINEEIRKDISSRSSIKLTKSQSSTSTNKPPLSVVSGRSTSYGSLTIMPPHHKRINMSFTNERLRDIERQNHILLNKIINVRNSHKSSIPTRGHPGSVVKPLASAAVMRKKEQRKIDYENMILLKKLQRAKSTSASIRR